MATTTAINKSTVSFLSALFMLAGILLTSCSSSKKLTPPSGPAPVHLPDTLPALPNSEIDLPLKIYARPWLAMADTLVPLEFTSDGWPAWLKASCEFRYKYRFVRSAFTLTCVNNLVNLHMDGSYQVAGSKCFCAMDKPVSPWVSGSCGFGKEPMRRVNIAIRSQIALTPDYRIRTRTSLEQLKAPDKCIVSLLSTDITQQITDSIRASISGFCGTLDQTLAGMDFANYIHQATSQAWQPMSIAPGGYLTVNPQSIRVGPLNLDKDTFRISVGLSCRPVCMSDSIHPSVLPPLPPLQSGPFKDGISLYLQADYSYPFISKLLHDSLQNKNFVFKGNHVIIRDVAIRGIGKHQVEVRVDFAGSRKGRIYFRGTPILDTAKQALSIPDIAYSLESKDLALRMAKTLFRGRIRKTLRGNSYLDLGALIRANLPALDSMMNRPVANNIYSRGHIRELRMIGLLAGERSCQVQLQIAGNLSVISTGLLTPQAFSRAGNH